MNSTSAAILSDQYKSKASVMSDNNDFKSGFEAGKDFKKKSLKAAGYAAGAAYSVAPKKRTPKKAMFIVVGLVIAGITGVIGYEVVTAYNKGMVTFDRQLAIQESCRKQNPDYVDVLEKLKAQPGNPFWQFETKCFALRNTARGPDSFFGSLGSHRDLARYFAAGKADEYRMERIDERMKADTEGTFTERFDRAWFAE